MHWPLGHSFGQGWASLLGLQAAQQSMACCHQAQCMPQPRARSAVTSSIPWLFKAVAEQLRPRPGLSPLPVLGNAKVKSVCNVGECLAVRHTSGFRAHITATACPPCMPALLLLLLWTKDIGRACFWAVACSQGQARSPIEVEIDSVLGPSMRVLQRRADKVETVVGTGNASTGQASGRCCRKDCAGAGPAPQLPGVGQQALRPA